MQAQQNHGGGRFAQKKGSNRKADKRYDKRALEYAKMVGQHKIGDGQREANGYPAPGSRKKVY